MNQLKPQVPFLGLVQLRDFAAQQTKRFEDVQRILKRGQGAIDTIKASAAPYFHGETRKIGNVEMRLSHPHDTGLKSQVVAQQSQVRQNIETELRPILEKMLAAKRMAAEYSARHWQKIQVLNRATSGNGAAEALTRRAAYAELFKIAGKAQLHDFGQFAIDTADAVLADCVYRAVADLPVNDRPFLPASLLQLVPNVEYDEAQQLLQSVIDAFDRAKRGLDTFDGGRHGQVTQSQIVAGLRERQQTAGVDDFNVDDIVDETGGIREDALVRLSKRSAN